MCETDIQEKGVLHSMKKQQSLKGFLFILPSLAGVLLFWVVPYADVIRRSFFSAVSGTFTGLKNYITIFQNEAFRLAAANTLRFFLTCIPVSDNRCSSYETETVHAGVQNHVFAANGNSGGLGRAFVARIVSQPGAFESSSTYLLVADKGLDEYIGLFLGAGGQLHLEKPGV